MNLMNYVIGTGYFNKKGNLLSDFHLLWHWNTLSFSSPAAIYTMCHAGSFPPSVTVGPGTFIVVDEDLGSHANVMQNKTDNAFCGWTISVVTLALLAYQNKSDFIFKEQDCLAFGNWVDEMYRQIGKCGLIFGNCKGMLCAQSLFMVRSWYIPEFVVRILEWKHERGEDRTGEHKFAKIERDYPNLATRFDFGYDRSRPFDPLSDTFYVQQLTGSELRLLEKAGRVHPGFSYSDDAQFSSH